MRTRAGGDDQGVALVVLARLVEVGVDELAGAIDHPLDPPRHRAPVHVAIEHAHEDRNPRQRPFAEPQLRRRHRIHHPADAAVGRRNHEALAQRRDADRVAEEIGAPGRRQRADPAERGPDEEQDQARQRKPADERIALRMDGRELRADGIDDGHGAILFRRGGGREIVVERRRIAVRGGRVLGDAGELLARLLRLALPVPHAGVEPALEQQFDGACRARR